MALLQQHKCQWHVLTNARRLVFSTSFLFFPFIAANADILPEFGPLYTPSQAPLQAATLTPTLQDPTWHPRHRQWTVSATAASIWGVSDQSFLDYYQNEMRLAYQQAIDHNWRFAVDYRYRFSANNHLDSLTIGFHDLFGIGQNGRDLIPKHQTTLLIPSEQLAQQGGSPFGFGHRLSLRIDHAFWSNQRHALSASGTLLYSHQPNGPFKHHNAEQSLQLNYRYAPSQQHHWYGMAGVSHRHKKEVMNIRAKRVNNHFALGYLYQWRPEHHFWGQLQFSEGIASDLDALRLPTYEAMLGYRYLFSPKHAVELSVLENLVYYDNSADVAFTLSYRQLF